MRKALIVVMLLGCASEDESDGVQFAKPLPTLVTLETPDGEVELRGAPELQAYENGPLKLVINADNGTYYVNLAVELPALPADWQGVSPLLFGESEDPALWQMGEGQVSAQVREGRTSGSFDAVLADGTVHKGRFAGKLGLFCAQAGSQGGGPSDGSSQLTWSQDADLSSAYCQGVQKALEL